MLGERGTDTETTEANPTRARTLTRARMWLPSGLDLWFPVAVFVAVIILTILGWSGSSVSLYSASGHTNESAVVAGQPRPIRSDEWQTSAPLRIGRVQGGFPDSATFGMGRVDLTDSWTPVLPSRSLGAALFSPFNLPLTLLPLNQGFALSWWLPFAACCLGLYAWLRAMKVSPIFSLAAAVITTMAPAAVWWSYSMVLIIGLAAIPAALIVAATRMWQRRRRLAIATAVVAALAAAGLPWWYEPWAYVAAVFIGGVTFLWGISDRVQRRSFLLLAGIAGAVFVSEELVYWLHEREYYEALTNTVYPGQRRFEGGGVPVGRLLSSINPFSFFGTSGDSLQYSNWTELSSGWTIAAPVAFAVTALTRRTIWRDRDRILLLGTVGLSILLTSWCLVRWPGILAKVTFIDLVSPERVGPFVGMFGTICLALLLGVPERRTRVLEELRRSGVWIVVGVTALIAAWGATELKILAFPAMSVRSLWLSVLVIAVVVALLLTRWWRWALGLAIAMAVVSGAMVNPVTDGIGALGDSHAATLVRKLDRTTIASSDGAWAADSGYVNGLLNAQGVNSLSSFNNPVSARGWRILDPDGKYEVEWNRYAYIIFDWKPGLTQPQMSNPAPDGVIVSADPCDSRLTRLNLRLVVATETLDAPCLRDVARFRWMGTNTIVYERTAGATGQPAQIDS